MIKFLAIFILFMFILLEIVDSTCEKPCLIKSYNLPENSSVSCFGECQVQVDFSVIEQEFFEEYLNFTLIGYNTKVSESKTIGFMFRKGTDSTGYMCSKDKSGQTNAFVSQGSITIPKGTSSYTNGNLYCSWILSKNDNIWPQSLGLKVNLHNDADYQIWILAGIATFKASNDLTELPIYRMQFTQCCGYAVRGDDNYALIVDQRTDSTDFMIQVLGELPNMVSVTLTDPQNVSILSNCGYRQNGFSAFVSNGTILTKLQLPQYKITDYRCSWSLPRLINTTNFQNLDTKKLYYDLEVIADKISIYNESNVKLINSARSLSSKLAYIIPLFLILHLLLFTC